MSMVTVSLSVVRNIIAYAFAASAPASAPASVVFVSVSLCLSPLSCSLSLLSVSVGPDSHWPSIMYGTALCLLGCVGCLLVLPSPRPPGPDAREGGASVYSRADDAETQGLVSGEATAHIEEEENEKEGQRPARFDKPDTLSQSWPVVVSTAVVLCFYLGESRFSKSERPREAERGARARERESLR